MYNFLQDSAGEKPKKGFRASANLSSIANRKSVKEASSGNNAANQLRTSLNLDFSVRRAQQMLHVTPYLDYKR